MRILVTGATGYVGSRLVTALLGHGHDVVVAARDPEKLGRLRLVRPSHADGARRRRPGFCGQRARGGRDTSMSSTTWCTASGSPASARPDKLRRGGGRPGPPSAPGWRASSTSVGSCPTAAHCPNTWPVAPRSPSALHVDGGAEVVWLGAAMIIGAGSTSFEMLRYVGDRFPLLPLPRWTDNPIDPISIRDVLHYLVAAVAPPCLPAPTTSPGPRATTYRGLLRRLRAGDRHPAGRAAVPEWTARCSPGSAGSCCRCPTAWPPILLHRWSFR